MHGGITFFGPQERRSAGRLRLPLSLRYTLYGTGAVESGLAIDVSSSGIAFKAGRGVPAGTLLAMHILVPSCHGVLESGGLLACTVEIVRVTRIDGDGLIMAGRFCRPPRLVWRGQQD